MTEGTDGTEITEGRRDVGHRGINNAEEPRTWRDEGHDWAENMEDHCGTGDLAELSR